MNSSTRSKNAMTNRANSFDVLKAMSLANKDIRLAPLSNILRIQRVKAGTQVTIGFEGDVVAGLANGRFVGGLILADAREYEETRRGIEKERTGSGSGVA
jgi:antitoxin (DNA-binding transcriptional repressor) of toxin-antitoxin stability system